MLTIEQKEKILRAFYREHLLPLAEAARQRGTLFFPLGKDEGTSSAASYYIDRRDDGNYVHEIDSANLAKELEALWRDFPELAALAGPVVELAETIKEDEESTEEISPFIYAMF
ncbi:MAG TPA: hypothetical protein VGO50_06600 [Pyrinomonadaceae bacterium]|jgi:hypothetical protein|nr:hypothetical protein [Pyrinomonadaceae bacterium]